MAGIYVHIPFCRSRCAYCDFFSTTREAEVEKYVGALCYEIAARSHELPSTRTNTIYFGGGTPSLLSAEQLRIILDCIYANYDVVDDVEVTMEMNPDDVERCAMHNVRCAMGRGAVNRVSLGIQTFDDNLLQLIRRRHDSGTAVRAVRSLQAAGCNNISIDLIYGLPGQTLEQWNHDLDIAFSLGIQHLSAYALSYEAGTPLTRWRNEGSIREVSEEVSVDMYDLLCRRAIESGFEHYEISNFAQPGRQSRHNSSYWTGEPYLGFGPGAHSYDGYCTRRANTPDLDYYVHCWQSSQDYEAYEIHEHLTPSDLYDEAVMCGLRTSRGVDLNSIRHRFGPQSLDYLLRMAAPHILAQRLVERDGHLCLTRQALMVSDDVMSDLMADDDLIKNGINKPNIK